MKKIEVNFHDANIVSIMYKAEKTMLIFGIQLDDKTTLDLVFDGIKGWDLSPFEIQNVLFGINFFDSKVPDYLFEEFESLTSFLGIINESKSKIAILEPSVGLGGFVIFTDIRVENHS